MRRWERRIGKAGYASVVDREQRARQRLIRERRRIEAGSRRCHKQLIEPRAAERAAGDLRAREFDHAIDAPVGRIAHDPPAAPFRVPQATVGVHG